MKNDMPFKQQDIDEIKSLFTKSISSLAKETQNDSNKSKTLRINLSGRRFVIALQLIGCLIQVIFTGKTSLRIKTK
jgi:hypothetical protein